MTFVVISALRVNYINSAYWEIFHAFLLSADVFQNKPFRKFLSGIPLKCLRIWTQIRPSILSGLIWFQTVCKGYQQMTHKQSIENAKDDFVLD